MRKLGLAGFAPGRRAKARRTEIAEIMPATPAPERGAPPLAARSAGACSLAEEGGARSGKSAEGSRKRAARGRGRARRGERSLFPPFPYFFARRAQKFSCAPCSSTWSISQGDPNSSESLRVLPAWSDPPTDPNSSHSRVSARGALKRCLSNPASYRFPRAKKNSRVLSFPASDPIFSEPRAF